MFDHIDNQCEYANNLKNIKLKKEKLKNEKLNKIIIELKIK